MSSVLDLMGRCIQTSSVLGLMGRCIQMSSVLDLMGRCIQTSSVLDLMGRCIQTSSVLGFTVISAAVCVQIQRSFEKWVAFIAFRHINFLQSEI